MRFSGILHVVSVIGAIATSVGCGSGNNSANSPTAPSNTPVLGVWTGTLTRPGGLAPLSIRWETPTLGSEGKFSGPLTLSNGQGASVQLSAEGGSSGNDKQGYKILMWFRSDAVAPNCTVRGNSEGAQAASSTPQGDPFPAPYTTIAVSVFNITYIGCTALVGPNGLNLAETVQLRLVKQ